MMSRQASPTLVHNDQISRRNASADVSPNTMTILTGLTETCVAFVSFNALRALSVITALLVLASTLDVMVLDGRLVALSIAEDDDLTDCEYYPGTDVPTHVWGIFWVQLNRTFVLILCIISVLSDVNWGGRCERVFQYCLPVLGLTFGTGPLGALQMMIGANMLSHYLEEFALVVCWLFFITGLLNFLFGLTFKRQLKDGRSFSRKERLRVQTAKLAPVTDPEDPPPPFYGGILRRGLTGSRGPTRDVKEPAAGPDRVATIAEAFGHRGASTQRGLHQVAGDNPLQANEAMEFIRTRAREANDRAEEQFATRYVSASQTSSRNNSISKHSIRSDRSGLGLPGAFVYDSEQGSNVVIGHPASRDTNYSECVAVKDGPLTSHRRAASDALSYRSGREYIDFTTWQRKGSDAGSLRSLDYRHEVQSSINGPAPSSVVGTHRYAMTSLAPSQVGGLHSRNVSLVSPTSTRITFKRRSLALAKAARKRISMASTATSRRTNRRSLLRPLYHTSSGRNHSSASLAAANFPSSSERRIVAQAALERERLHRLALELKLQSPTEHGTAQSMVELQPMPTGKIIEPRTLWTSRRQEAEAEAQAMRERDRSIVHRTHRGQDDNDEEEEDPGLCQILPVYERYHHDRSPSYREERPI